MADEKQITEILKNIPLFGSLKRKQISNLARIVVERRCDGNDVIIPQGRDGYGLFIIVSGKAQAIRRHTDGTETVVNTFGPNEFFGELSLLDNGARTASVVATEPTQCLILPRESFLSVLRRDSDMAIEIMVELAKRFRITLESM